MTPAELQARLTSEANRLDPPAYWEFNEQGQKLGLHSMAHLLRAAAAALQAQAEEIAELKRQQEISSNHCRIYHVDAAKDDV